MHRLLFLFTSILMAAPRVLVVGDAPVPKRFETLRVQAADGAFPPGGVAYRDQAAAHRLWRAIHSFAPDIVLTAQPMPELAKALEGTVPVVSKLPRQVVPSSLSQERARRVQRTPRQLAEELSQVYGHELKDVVYIPAFAVIARHRLGQNVDELLQPYWSGAKDSLAKATASHFSGHLVFAEFNTPASLARVRAAADLAIAQRAQHNEMSDAVFMGCPLLARAGQLTGERKYVDAALDHLAFMQKLCRRPDGIYRHSPLNEAAWGRGNAFPAFGMALMLDALPEADRAKPLADFRQLIDALLPYQSAQGLWREVIDHPKAFEEFSATAMIGASIHQGLRRGWLKGARYEKAVERAWTAIQERTSSDGKLMDVCESTGKQTTLEAYLQRTAIWDRDPRGGAMALYFATEMLAK